MKKYRLLALDMDGTLLREDKTISPATVKALRDAAEAGIIICFATGRGRKGALPYAEELGLPIPIVAVNGGEIWTAEGQLFDRTIMDVNDIRRLRAIALSYKEPWYWGYSTERVFNKDEWARNEDDYTWLKFGYYTEQEDVLANIRRQASGMGVFEITNSHPYNLELNPAGVTKASGLRKLCGLLGLSMDEVVAAGDSLNDLSMIEEAGLGVAMGNAQAAVIQAANTVARSNEEDGIAWIVREWLL